MKKATYVFSCSVCHKEFRSDEPGEPCCTGPSEMRDDHEMVVMHLKSINQVEVHPEVAEKRSVGGLLMPWMEKSVRKDIVEITQKEPNDQRVYSFPRLVVPTPSLREPESANGVLLGVVPST